MNPRNRILILFLTLAVLTGLFVQWRRVWLEQSQDQNILSAARRHEVDPALVKAVIWRESRFNPVARGRKKEIGLMQILPEAAGKDWALAQHVTNYSADVLFDAAQNVECGTWYLHKLLGRYRNTDNPIPYALADYNAGRANALRWMEGAGATNSAVFIARIGFPGTREYVRAIMVRRSKYASWAAARTAKS